jgi:putative addiction module killer protein
MGDCKALGGGLMELRVNEGPGYRIYFAIPDSESVLLIGGGTKATQAADIRVAGRRWEQQKRNANS